MTPPETAKGFRYALVKHTHIIWADSTEVVAQEYQLGDVLWQYNSANKRYERVIGQRIAGHLSITEEHHRLA